MTLTLVQSVLHNQNVFHGSHRRFLFLERLPSLALLSIMEFSWHGLLTPRILSSLFLFSTCFCPFVSASAAWTEKAERSETITGQNVPDGVASSPRGLEPLCGAVICD